MMFSEKPCICKVFLLTGNVYFKNETKFKTSKTN